MFVGAWNEHLDPIDCWCNPPFRMGRTWTFGPSAVSWVRAPWPGWAGLWMILDANQLVDFSITWFTSMDVWWCLVLDFGLNQVLILQFNSMSFPLKVYWLWGFSHRCQVSWRMVNPSSRESLRCRHAPLRAAGSWKKCVCLKMLLKSMI